MDESRAGKISKGIEGRAPQEQRNPQERHLIQMNAMDNKQLELFPGLIEADTRPPETVTWNLWHGCTKVSPGCRHCYMYRRDERIGKDPSTVRKTQSFNLPVRILSSGPHKGRYKVSCGSVFYTCFSSDFFHPDADEWRNDAWDMIRERSDCTFFMITKRPERIAENLPSDWNNGWDHVHIAVTCENQDMAEKRLPVYLPLPLRHHSIMVEPMLTPVDLRRYFRNYQGIIEVVSCGGESGPEARICEFSWVLDLRKQCVENGISFTYHQTGARLLKDEKVYQIPRNRQHEQAAKAKLDYNGKSLFNTMPGEEKADSEA